MQLLDLLAFYHWIIIALGFSLLGVLKVGGISVPGCVSALLMAVITYVYPDVYWTWQIAGTAALTAFFSLPLMGGRLDAQAAAAATQQPAVDPASLMIGGQVKLLDDLHDGQGRLFIRGKYWRVRAAENYPAGTVVAVNSIDAGILNVVHSETAGSGLAFEHFQRCPELEKEFGAPDSQLWEMFQQARGEHSKLSLVQAYHLLCGLRGDRLSQGRAGLNTHTLALYDEDSEGRFTAIRPNLYSDTGYYNFYYGDGCWQGQSGDSFEVEMDQLEAALNTPWADEVRGPVPREQMALAIRLLREAYKDR